MMIYEQNHANYGYQNDSTYHEDYVTQENERAVKQDSSTHSVSSSSSSTSTGARARTRVSDAQKQVDDSRADMLYGQYLDCCQYYAENFRRSIVPQIQRQIAELIRGGMTGEVIRMAIDETQMAPRPSWAYCAAILRRCERDGINTLADWMEDRRRYQSRMNPAMNYQQRQYTDDDYGPDFFAIS